ncbi:MAG: hypothetical protein U9R37_09125 [Campylobacterota bacterium]|nr:hypothetical protein [Campylobacterota bacterium]
MQKTDSFSKRLTVLFLKDKTNNYDNFLLDTFGSVIFCYSLDEAIDLFYKNHIDLVLVEFDSIDQNKFNFLHKIILKRQFIITIVISKNRSFNLIKKKYGYRRR